MPIQRVYPIFNWIVFLLLTFESSLYIPDMKALSDTCFANIFSSQIVFSFS